MATAADAVWLDANGRPNASARDALRLIADAADDGMDPQDYQAGELAQRAAALADAAGATGAPSLAFERDLDAAITRFARDLHLGRVDPRALGFRVPPARRAAPDFAALVRSAAAQRRLPQALENLRPRLGQYARLRQALAHYRALATAPAAAPLPATVPVKPDDPYPAAQPLHDRLLALGDLDARATAPDGHYAATLVEGVKRFQGRHGLEPDGVIGRATLAALNVPLAQRVQQLELALERLRWLPDLGAQAFVGINIPMFRLWAWDPATPETAPIGMSVVVGRALDTQTPVLFEDMRYLIFRPYWNVPRSIVRNEVLPALARDPSYLRRHNMEMVRGASDDAPALPESAQNLALLREGALRLRQRPGPGNSLGLVKFIFPNDANVYLHGTPATQLFGRARRDFSHGCVRVEEPVTLAQWVLRDQPQWTRERIEAAMAGSAPMRVNLTRPLPVILFYLTAMVMPSAPGPLFAADIYGHDARLMRALASRAR